ncbi:uncharacterized protein N0V96_009344 [Colletotrichum fioriniae]|uniref:uncharacterized protein n=1 Tax=Colletotrichum fioriniae TaxID=710243 RepID=UPI0032DB19A7|nr:hypothetical protein N0V96_009344 [Colletotrichum fioriniae]
MSASDTQFFKKSLRSEYWINFNVDKKFSLAGVDGPELDNEERELVRTWASTKDATKIPAQAQPSSLYRPILDPFEIRVLEILPGTGADKLRGRLRHCSLELKASFALAVDGSAAPMVYTALSYTWGPNVFDETIECEGHVKNITKSLALALRAFRQEHSSVVMWIDQICINQDDNEEKAQQIPLMSRIYQNAMNTVIWLGESTSNSASAIKLLEDVRLLLQFTEKTIGPDDFEGLNLPSKDSEVWEAFKNKNELRLYGISVDTIAKVSATFTNPELSLDDPTTANEDLKDMRSFVTKLEEYPGSGTVFSAFWQTLVAGKDVTEMAKAPTAYEEVISLLLDESTGLSPSLPGQTYSARQRRPAGKGKLELANLKTRTAGKTFQDVRTSMVHAVRNRRLCFTDKGGKLARID